MLSYREKKEWRKELGESDKPSQEWRREAREREREFGKPGALSLRVQRRVDSRNKGEETKSERGASKRKATKCITGSETGDPLITFEQPFPRKGPRQQPKSDQEKKGTRTSGSRELLRPGDGRKGREGRGTSTNWSSWTHERQVTQHNKNAHSGGGGEETGR